MNMDSERHGDPEGQLPVDTLTIVLADHEEQTHTMDELLGKKGLLICFLNDIWLRASAERIRWLQQHYFAFEQLGIGVVLVVVNQPHTLRGYYASSPIPPRFTCLSDADLQIHRAFEMDRQSGLLLIDRKQKVRCRWLSGENHPWPRAREVKQAVRTL